jgi:hypothetical protein
MNGYFMRKKVLLSLVLLTIVGSVTVLWAQDTPDCSSANSMLYSVEVTSMTQGGTRRVDSITVLASDPREAEREAEAEFRRTNSRSTFIRAVASVPEAYLLNSSENMEPAPSASRTVSPNPDGRMLFAVEITSMTQGGTRRVDSITVLASDPREAEREAEAEFNRTNSRSTFIRAVAR